MLIDPFGNKIAYTYDANGNVLEAHSETGTIYYTYTSFNELATLETEDGTKTTYSYDTQGIRTAKVIETTASTQHHKFYYAFGEYIGEEVADRQIAYIYGIGLLGQIQNGKAYTTFTNGQGDVVYVQDQDNTLVCYYAYDAFGNRIEVLETLYNPMTYRGNYYDQESGDYYLRARY